eukprot:TRINITY_DN1673_c0_g2_i1.p1 TRINITY_DN1673_c0_g2~~TRINITY_DN1673_c0_g2_i1.p1  ORF type:complete len:377 (-),score=39.32 TRINITY_DN1673_c0_g2_i1:1026-2156(-)
MAVHVFRGISTGFLGQNVPRHCQHDETSYRNLLQRREPKSRNQARVFAGRSNKRIHEQLEGPIPLCLASATPLVGDEDSGPIVLEEDVAQRICECHNLSDQLVPYVSAWKWQQAAIGARVRARQDGLPFNDTVLLLQHPPVYTLGTRSTTDHLKFDPAAPPGGAEMHRTERGGEVTYHGPGQLVLYPILDLRQQQADLHWYLRALEEVVMRTLAAFDIVGERVPGFTGVWADGRKLAAIGVRVSRWVSYHGVALNVTTNLAAFDHIVPCGLQLPVGNMLSHHGLRHLSAAGALEHDPLPEGSRANLDDLVVRDRRCLKERAVFLSEAGSNIREDGPCSNHFETRLLEAVSERLLLEFADVFNLQLVAPTIASPRSL